MIVYCERLFDGEELHEKARVRITGEEITSVEPMAAGREGPEEADGLLRTRFCMPGLIDCHAHAFGYQESLPVGEPFGPHERFLEVALCAGVTALRDMGNTLEAIGHLRTWGEEHGAPRLHCAGPILDQPPFSWPFTRGVAGVEEARLEVERLALEGVEFIKVYRNVPARLVEAVVKAAAAHGLGVALHIGETTATEGLRLGVRSLEHLIYLLDPSWVQGENGNGAGSLLDRLQAWGRVDLDAAPVDSFVAETAASGVFICPALITTRRRVFLDEVINERLLDLLIPIMPYHRHFKGMRNPVGYAVGKRFLQRRLPYPKLDRAAAKSAEWGWSRLGEMLVRLSRAGVRLVAGTDSPNPSVVPGFGLHWELMQWGRFGVPPIDVLRAATATAGDMVGDRTLGRVRPGAKADLLLLDEDPLEDLRALASESKRVVCRGRLVDKQVLLENLHAAVEAL